MIPIPETDAPSSRRLTLGDSLLRGIPRAYSILFFSGSGRLGWWLLAISMLIMIITTRRAQRLAQQKIEFVAAISHELRTPLAVICSAGENLADGVVPDLQRARQYGNVIHNEGRRLAEMVDQPIQVFHVSCPEVAEEIARAKARGLKVWGETCPQYFVLSADHMDRPGFEGAKFMCSPAPRDAAASEGLWKMIQDGVLDIASSDHSGWSYETPVGFSAVPSRASPLQPRKRSCVRCMESRSSNQPIR